MKSKIHDQWVGPVALAMVLGAVAATAGCQKKQEPAATTTPTAEAPAETPPPAEPMPPAETAPATSAEAPAATSPPAQVPPPADTPTEGEKKDQTPPPPSK
ncbi:MAG TPA: hypothetical protein VIT66_10625 [Lysobacter sp.]